MRPTDKCADWSHGRDGTHDDRDHDGRDHAHARDHDRRDHDGREHDRRDHALDPGPAQAKPLPLIGYRSR